MGDQGSDDEFVQELLRRIAVVEVIDEALTRWTEVSKVISASHDEAEAEHRVRALLGLSSDALVSAVLDQQQRRATVEQRERVASDLRELRSDLKRELAKGKSPDS